MVTNESAELMGAVVGMNPAILLSEPRTVKSAISSAGLSYEGKGQYNDIIVYMYNRGPCRSPQFEIIIVGSVTRVLMVQIQRFYDFLKA